MPDIYSIPPAAIAAAFIAICITLLSIAVTIVMRFKHKKQLDGEEQGDVNNHSSPQPPETSYKDQQEVPPQDPFDEAESDGESSSLTLESIQEEISRLKGSIETLSSGLEAVQGQVLEIESEMASLKKELSEFICTCTKSDISKILNSVGKLESIFPALHKIEHSCQETNDHILSLIGNSGTNRARHPPNNDISQPQTTRDSQHHTDTRNFVLVDDHTTEPLDTETTSNQENKKEFKKTTYNSERLQLFIAHYNNCFKSKTKQLSAEWDYARCKVSQTDRLQRYRDQYDDREDCIFLVVDIDDREYIVPDLALILTSVFGDRYRPSYKQHFGHVFNLEDYHPSGEFLIHPAEHKNGRIIKGTLALG